MAPVRIEFTVEPFVDGQPGPHVLSAIAAVEGRGLPVDVGPFSTIADVPSEALGSTVADLVHAAFEHGATGLTLRLDRTAEDANVSDGAVASRDQPLFDALEPVADALGASLVRGVHLDPADIPLRWEGELVGGLRLPQLHGALSRLIEQVERELGGRLPDLSREAKQQAVHLLDDRGAFLLRRSVEDVADALGVSRITVYNYLNAIRS